MAGIERRLVRTQDKSISSCALQRLGAPKVGIANSVERLAAAIADQRHLSDWQRDVVRELRAMPVHLAAKALAVWEQAVQQCWPADDEDTKNALLLWAVFELGRSNLYSAFDSVASFQALHEVEKCFKHADIALPAGLDVSCW